MRTTPSPCDDVWPTRRSPGSLTKSVRACQVLRPRRVARALAIAHSNVLPSATQTASAPRNSFLSRLNGWPARSPTDASPTSSRMSAHGSGPMWFATPSSQWTCTTYSLPVSRRTCVKTQNQFPRFRFWRFLIKKFAQNRATIDIIALFCAAKLVVTSFYTASANSGHSSRTLNFLHSGHWNDLRGTEGIASEPHRRLSSETSTPASHRLEARLLAQGVHERVGLQILQARITQPQRRLEPFERLRPDRPTARRSWRTGRPRTSPCAAFSFESSASASACRPSLS